mgnify:CR=1 FL=1
MLVVASPQAVVESRANPISEALVIALSAINLDQDPKTYASIIQQLLKSFPSSLTVQKYAENFEKIKIKVPTKIEDQEKIANKLLKYTTATQYL